MSKKTKGFSEYIEETDLVRKKKLKRESRHNYKAHLMDVIESENWDELEDELDEQGRIHRR
jgi:hypothetical protein